MRTHRVGTITLGASLIVFGVLFSVRLFTDAVSLELVMKLWPLILIGLGVEILVSTMVRKEEKMKFDVPAIILTFVLGAFSMSMAFFQMMIEMELNFTL